MNQYSILAAASSSSAIIGTLATRAYLSGVDDVFADRINAVAQQAEQALSEGKVTVRELQEALWAGTGTRKERRAQLARIRKKHKKGN